MVRPSVDENFSLMPTQTTKALAGFQGARSWMKGKKLIGTNGKPYGKAPSNLMDYHRLARCFLCEG